MNSSNQSSQQLLAPPSLPRALIFIAISLAALGFLDAAYLTVQHYIGQVPPCTTEGCEAVLTSPYATLAGIPIALLGALYYLALGILAISYLDIKHDLLLRTFMLTVMNGFLISLGLLYLQLFVLKAICLYCMFSLGISAALFALVVYMYWRRNRHTSPVI